MDKAVEMGKTSATGSFQLFVGRIASTFVLAIGSIVVGIFINEAEYGLYTIAVVPAATFLLFQDWGVGSALTRYCANYRAAKMEGELRNIVVAGLTFEFATGLALTLLSILVANFVASTMFGNPESGLLIAVSSITILSAAILVGSQSVITGFEQMKLTIIPSVVSAATQGLLSPLLVYLGFGAFGAVVGVTAASVASSITALSLLYFAIFRKLPPGNLDKVKVFQSFKILLSYGIPIAVASIISGIGPQLYSFIMASSTDITLIGNFKIATNFGIFVTFFTMPIQTVLFPVFSKLHPSRDKELVKTVFASSIKYSSILLVPATIAIMVLSTPLITTVYGDKWPFAPFFLAIYVIGYLFVLLGVFSYDRLLYATGDTKFLLKLSALGLCIGIPFAFLLIPPLGILGLIIVGQVSGVPTMLIGLYWTWKHYETKVDLRNSARILLASLAAGAITCLFLNIFNAAAWIMLAAGVLLFMVSYLVSAPLVGAVNQMDLNNLRAMFSGLGPVSKLLQIPLAIVETILKAKEKRSKTY